MCLHPLVLSQIFRFSHEAMGARMLAALSTSSVGSGLNRPESVLALKDGRVYASDKAKGVVRVLPEPSRNPDIESPPPEFVPNGISLLKDGTFLIANVGPGGGLWQLVAPGELVPFVKGGHGFPETPLGFVNCDHAGRTWLAFTTTSKPRDKAFNKNVADGAVGIIEPSGAIRICAEGLSFPNEVRVHPGGKWLYVTETFARRMTRFEIGRDAKLSNRETVCTFGTGIWPDGFEFDVQGNAWVTSVVSNRLVMVRPDGSAEIQFEDCDIGLLAKAEENYQSGCMGWSDIAVGQSAQLGNIASIAFGGPGRLQAYIGSMGRDSLTMWAAKVTGVEPVHWNFSHSVID